MARILMTISLCLLMCQASLAQQFAAKSNLLVDATLSPNVGLELGVAPRWTVEASGSLNAWAIDGKRWKHWMAQPALRYWFCDRFAGHHIGIHALGGQYNVGGFDPGFSLFGKDFSKLKDTRYQGWFVGGGIEYGYDWVLSRHWNFELEIGLGYAYSRYDKFRCAGCGARVEENRPAHYVGPTKAAANLVYTF